MDETVGLLLLGHEGLLAEVLDHYLIVHARLVLESLGGELVLVLMVVATLHRFHTLLAKVVSNFVLCLEAQVIVILTPEHEATVG